jgi:ActR/RegA family two-component response regulator
LFWQASRNWTRLQRRPEVTVKPLVGKAAMHILIVEDDPVVADVLGMTLEEARHFQSIAHNSETTLAELKHNTVDAVRLT